VRAGGELMNRKSAQPPGWVVVAGYVTAVLTLLFLMGLVMASVVGHTVPAGSHFLLVAVLSLGLALSFGFIGGSAAAEGKVPIPGLAEHPVTFSVAGGIGAFFLCLLLGMRLYPEPGPSPSPAPIEPSPTATNAAVGDSSPPRFDLKFNVAAAVFGSATSDNPNPNLSFKQRLPSDSEPETIAFQTEYYLVKDIRFPQPGGRYLADFRPAVTSSQFVAAGGTEPRHSLCFERKRKDPPHAGDEARRYAVMRCPDPERCVVDTELDQSWIEACSDQHAFDFRSLFIGRALAQPAAGTPAGTPVDAPHWIVPSLDTLVLRNQGRSDGPAYTRFVIAGKPSAEGATHVGLLVKANGTPVYVDGWSPRDRRRPWQPSQALELEFALENLDFSGGGDGFESLEADLIFYRGDEIVKQTALTRRLVAMRDAPPPEQITASDGAAFTWSGTYTPPEKEDKFGIFALSTKDLSAAQRVKQRIDASDTRLDGQRIVAVLRPPLQPWRLQQYSNPNYAVLIGLKQPNGQVRFTFDEQLANQLCKTVYRERASYHGAVLESVFRYEWPPVTTNKYLLCRTL
jgi:hypothetical protein